MEATLRRQIPDLIAGLYAKPYEFELSQALKIYEYLFPESPEIGSPEALGRERIRFKSRITLSTASSDIHQVYNVPEDNVVMVINMLGIAGIQGPLPTPYSEMILDRLSKKDTAFADFLDMFNHRLITLKTKTSKLFNPTLSKYQPQQTMLGRAVLSATGLENYQSCVSVNPRAMLRYAGLMWHNTRSAAGFKAIVSDYFKVRAGIHLLEGRWLPLDEDDQTKLGAVNTVLGQDAVLGTRAWSADTCFKLSLGPMNGFMFRQFQKNGKAYKELMNIAKEYLPQGQKFYINLIMDKNDITPTKLDGKSALGWTGWSYSSRPGHDDRQVHIYPD